MLQTRPPAETRPPDPAPGDHGEIHRSTSDAAARTWEMELLISGGVVFALLQPLEAVDGWYYRAAAQAAGSGQELVEYVYYYLKLILYTLIVTFVLHLSARAYWVGLIGLDTVFPHGVRWEKLTYGPISKEVHRRRQPSLEAVIVRVDRFCSVIFSAAFSIVFVFLLSLVVIPLLLLAAVLLSRFLFDGRHLSAITQGLVALVFGPAVIASFVDARFGKRLDPARGAGRLIRRITEITYALFGGAAISPVLNILFSNIRKAALYPVLILAFLGVITFHFVADRMIPSERLVLGSFSFLPDRPEGRGIANQHYLDRREPRALELLPTIQSDVVQGPFVRLFLPYVPARHELLIPRRCPGVRAVSPGSVRLVEADPSAPPEGETRAILDCLTGLQPVTLNGRPVPGLDFHFARDPENGVRGIMAYLPTAGLPEGRNLLVVGALPDPEPEEDEKAPRPHHIPFWFAPATPRPTLP